MASGDLHNLAFSRLSARKQGTGWLSKHPEHTILQQQDSLFQHTWKNCGPQFWHAFSHLQLSIVPLVSLSVRHECASSGK